MVCDLDGVVYLHDRPIPGSGEALARLEELGFRVLFVTNSSTTPRAEVAGRIADLVGYRARSDQVLTSAEAAVSVLSREDGPCLVLGGDGIRVAVGEAGLGLTETWEEAGTVLCGLDWDLTYPRLRDAVLAIRSGARFVATNDDPTFPAPSGLWPGAGAVVAALRAATDRDPEVAGKPHEPMRRLVRRHLGPGTTWVVGDRPSTDLAMARREGWRGVLVLSGVVEDPVGLLEGEEPDVVLERLGDLPGFLAEGEAARPAPDAAQE